MVDIPDDWIPMDTFEGERGTAYVMPFDEDIPELALVGVVELEGEGEFAVFCPYDAVEASEDNVDVFVFHWRMIKKQPLIKMVEDDEVTEKVLALAFGDDD